MTELPIPKDRNIFFSKQVNQASIEEITKKIIDINDNDAHLKKLYDLYSLDYNPKPMKLFIDSYGGTVYQILGLISVIENSVVPVHTICTGTAMSCGFLLLISGHKRFAYKNSTPLYHQVSSVHIGKVKELEEELEETKRLQEKIEEITLAKTKITKKQLEKNYKRKIDWFMTAEEAKKLGVIDEII